MKLLKISIIAISLGTFITSCGSNVKCDTATSDSTSSATTTSTTGVGAANSGKDTTGAAAMGNSNSNNNGNGSNSGSNAANGSASGNTHARNGGTQTIVQHTGGLDTHDPGSNMDTGGQSSAYKKEVKKKPSGKFTSGNGNDPNN